MMRRHFNDSSWNLIKSRARMLQDILLWRNSDVPSFRRTSRGFVSTWQTRRFLNPLVFFVATFASFYETRNNSRISLNSFVSEARTGSDVTHVVFKNSFAEPAVLNVFDTPTREVHVPEKNSNFGMQHKQDPEKYSRFFVFFSAVIAAKMHFRSFIYLLCALSSQNQDFQLLLPKISHLSFSLYGARLFIKKIQ